ncbi:MAG: flagellar basal body rod protein FlgB [Planctomycetes bacterium]|nr:flagellar basal body rod protein FlgB [Planctomycetota bacterium]MCB9905048.1 flagellar basal body rod protein FlgB [Planctomycetota bacterium]
MDVSGNNGRLLVNLMSAAARRAEVIANNIANQNTPGFKRSTVEFEDLLARELRSGASGRDLLALAPEEQIDLVSPSNGEGNNVHMELETNAMNQNRLMYETYSAILKTRMELIRASIEESR